MELEFYLDDNLVEHPAGWQGLKLVLERHEDYHGVVEYLDVDLIWIGDAAEYIKSKIEEQTPDVVIRCEVRLKAQPIFTGVLACKLAEFIVFDEVFKVKCPLIPDTPWSSLINNKSVEYNLSETSSRNIYLPPQMFLGRYALKQISRTSSGSFTEGNPLYLMHHFEPDEDTISVFDYGMNISALHPVDNKKYFFKAKYSGVYTFNYQVHVTVILTTFPSSNFKLRWYVARNNVSTPIGSEVLSSGGVIKLSQGYSSVLNLNKGDEIYFYGILTLTSVWPASFNFISSALYDQVYYTSLTVSAELYDDLTTVEMQRIDDSLKFLIKKATGVLPQIKGIDVNYAIAKGKHLRGFTFSEVPFNMSFEKLFNSLTNIQPIGMFYDGTKIVIDKAENFYTDQVFIELATPPVVTIKIDNSKIFNTMVVGYQKWETEMAGGTREMFGKITYSLSLSSSGTEINKLSEFIASNYAIENTRQNRIERDKDFRTDEDVFIIAIRDNEAERAHQSGVPFIPMHISHYNARILPGENFKRWLKFISTIGLNYRITSYHGNIRTLEYDNLSEPSVFVPYTISVSVPMAFDDYVEIRDNRHSLIRLTTESDTIDVYVKKLEYSIYEGKAEIVGILKKIKITFLLLEAGGYILLEDNAKITLE